jgi:hypothetical protein
MTFISERLFEQKVSPLCSTDIANILNWATYHMSYDWCQFIRIEDTNVDVTSYLLLSDTTDINYVGKASYIPVVNDIEDALTLQFVWSEILPVTIDLQTTFILTQPVRLPGNNTRLYVNWKKTNYWIQYIFTDATTLVWQNVWYSLDTNDTVELYHI